MTELMQQQLIRVLMLLGITITATAFVSSWAYMMHLRSLARNGGILAYFQEPTKKLKREVRRVIQSSKDARPVIISHNVEYVIDDTKQLEETYGFWIFVVTLPIQRWKRGEWPAQTWDTTDFENNPNALCATLKAFRNVAIVGEFLDRLSDEMGVNRMKQLQMLMLVTIVIMIVGMGAMGFMLYKIYPAVLKIQQALGG